MFLILSEPLDSAFLMHDLSKARDLIGRFTTKPKFLDCHNSDRVHIMSWDRKIELTVEISFMWKIIEEMTSLVQHIFGRT